MPAEVLRLRDRIHDLANTVTAHEYRLQRVEQLWKHFEPIIEDLREVDRIAEGVAKKMSEQQAAQLTLGSIRLTKTQRWGVRVGATLGFATLLVDLYSHFA